MEGVRWVLDSCCRAFRLPIATCNALLSIMILMKRLQARLRLDVHFAEYARLGLRPPLHFVLGCLRG